MNKFPLSSCLFSLLLVTGACAADLGAGEPVTDNSTGDNSGNGDGSGSGNGDGSGSGDESGNGDGDPGDGSGDDLTLPTLCEMGAFAAGESAGYFFAADAQFSAEVQAEVFVEDETSYSGLIIAIAEGAGVTNLGPGSYTLSEAASFGESCNPCIIAMSGTEAGQLEALATTGSLQIDSLDPQVGGRFAGQVTGLQVKEIDANGAAGSCTLSVPNTSFDVTLTAGGASSVP